MRKIILILVFTLSLIITGCGETENKPVIEGAKDLSILQGTTFEEMEGITATDVEDGDLTDLIELEGSVNTLTIGEQTIIYIVEDSDGNETSIEVIVTVLEYSVEFYEMLNPGFSNGVQGWSIIYSDSATGTFEVVDEVLEVDIINVGSLFYDINVYQEDKEIDMDKMYSITFKAKADDERTIRLGIVDTETVVDQLLDNLAGEIILYDLTTDWVTYEYLFVPGVSIDTVRFSLLLGNIAGLNLATKVYIDDFLIEELDLDTYPKIMGAVYVEVEIGTDFSVLDGISAFDTEDGVITHYLTTTGDFDINKIGLYFIKYFVSDSFGNTIEESRFIKVIFVDEVWEINNPNFEFGDCGWEIDSVNTGESTYEVIDGVLIVDIIDIGDMFFDTRVFQSEKEVNIDTLYKVSFRAKADIARTIRLGVVDTETAVGDLLVSLTGEIILFDITTEWGTYEYIFDPSVSLDTVRIALLMGAVVGSDPATKVYIDDFSMDVYVEEPWEIINPDFELGTYGWNITSLNTGESTHEVVDGVLEVDITEIGEFVYDTIVRQSNKEIDMDTMYLVTVIAKADVARTIRLAIVDTETVVDGVLLNLAGEIVLFELTTEWVTYEYIFDPSVSLDTVRFALLMGNVTDTDPITKVYIDYFVVTEYIPD